MNKSHYDHAQLYEYVKGIMNEKKAAAIRQHLVGCGDCSEKIRQIHRTVLKLRNELQPLPAGIKRNVFPFKGFDLFLKPAFAMMLGITCATMSGMFVCISGMHVNNIERIGNFMSDTYRTFNDADYYRSIYMKINL